MTTGNYLKRSNLIEKGIELLVSKTSERAFGASITDIESQPQFKEACIVKKCTHNTNKYKQGWARNKRKTHTKCNKDVLIVINELFDKSNKGEIPKLRPKEVNKYLVEKKTEKEKKFEFKIKDIPNKNYIKSKFSTLLRNLKIKEENKKIVKRRCIDKNNTSDSNSSYESSDTDEYLLRIQPHRSNKNIGEYNI